MRYVWFIREKTANTESLSRKYKLRNFPFFNFPINEERSHKTPLFICPGIVDLIFKVFIL